MDHWGNDVSWINCLGKGVAIFKLSYNYMQMISLQNIMEKIIHDVMTLFLFNILKLLFSLFLYIYLIFLLSTAVLNGLLSHI